MELKELIHWDKPPCPRCPYTLGLIHMLRNPCPQCKQNGYKTYLWLTKQRLGEMANDE